MLEKMGFKGRLGKNENGIDKPIQTKERPKNLGLGYNGFNEFGSLKANKKMFEEVNGKEYKDSSEEESEEEEEDMTKWRIGDEFDEIKVIENEDEDEDDENYNKRRKRNKKKKSKNNENDEQQSINSIGFGITDVILDLTGSEPVLRKMKDKKSVIPGVDTSKHIIGKELVYNIILLETTSKSKLQEINDKIIICDERIKEMKKDLIKTNIRINETEKRLSNLEIIFEKLKILKNKDPLLLDDICDFMVEIKKNFLSEYKLYRIVNMIYPLLKKSIEIELDKWDPIENPEELCIIETFFNYEFLSQFNENEGKENEGKDKYSSDEYKITIQIIESIILPKIRSCINNKWVVQKPTSILFIVEILSHLLPAIEFKSFLDKYLYEKIHSTINNWNPSRERIPISNWVIPWIKYFNVEIPLTYKTIKFKIGNVLNRWSENSLDNSVYLMIKPWKGVFDDEIMNSLLVQSVIPVLIKIVDSIDCNLDSFFNNNVNKNIEKLNYILSKWSEILYPNQLILLLKNELFDRIKNEIYRYLFNNNNYYNYINVEILIKYYSYWRNIFNILIGGNDEIRREFIIILHIIECKLNNEKQYDLYINNNNNNNNKMINDYNYNNKSNNNSNNKKSFFYTEVEDNNSISFIDIISEYASKNDITFINSSQTFNGKKLYLFGNLKFYIEDDICYVFINDSNSYEALSLEEMMKLNKK